MHRYYTPFGSISSPTRTYHLNKEYSKDFVYSTYTLCIFNSYNIDTTIEEVVDDLESWDTLTFLGTETSRVGNEYKVYYVFSTEPAERNPIRSYVHLPIGKMGRFEQEMNIVAATYAAVPLPILARGAKQVFESMYPWTKNKFNVEEGFIELNNEELPCWVVTDGINQLFSAVELFNDHLIILEYNILVDSEMTDDGTYYTVNREPEFNHALREYVMNLYQ